MLTTEQLTPTLVRVVLGGPGLEAFEMPDATDTYINIAVPPAHATYGPVYDPRAVHDTLPREMWPARRRYTVRRWDATTQHLTLDFVVHATSGAAGPWAAAAEPGDVLVFNGPGSDYRPDPTADWHLLIGDESALPAIAVSLEVLDAEAIAVVRLVCDGPEHELELTSPAALDLAWVHRTENDPAPLPAAAAALSFPGGRVDAFVHGEADEIREIRHHLLAQRGLSDTDLSCSPYWRRGMTDEEWRSIKRDFVASMNADAA